jgi:hypothetical protein
VKKAQNTKLLAGVVGGSLLLLIVGFLAMVKPRFDEAKQVARQADDVRAQIETLRGQIQPTNEELIRVADIFRLSRAMPDRPDVPDVLLELSQVANETGITFKSITPKDPETVGAYTALPIDLVFEGNFYDVSDFLYRMRNLVDVHGGGLTVGGRLFAISSLALGEGDAKFPKVEATMTVTAFVYGTGTPLPSTTPSVAVAPSGATAAPAPVTP